MRQRRFIVGLLVATVALSMASASADAPLYEPRVLDQVGKVVPGGACTAESVFESSGSRFDLAPPYDQCQRLQVVFGPIWAKPGQNDVLIQPVTFEKPMFDGYITRFKPDLVGVDGESPRVKDLHLHHGTWLNAGRSYGWGPWIATGEEKTIAVWPKGFGLKVLGDDTWLFLHMIHNATPQTFPVWVQYDLDFVPAPAAEAPGEDGTPLIQNTKGIWLDVGDCSWDANTSAPCVKDSFNPIFNIQRGRGADGVCVFPRAMCAHQNTLAGTSAQQGIDVGTVYDDWKIPEDGTIVMMGGHLHFGGLRDDVYLVRDIDADGNLDAAEDADGDAVTSADEVKLIMVSDGLYWDEDFDPNAWQPGDAFDLAKNVVGGAPTSWDMVMTGTTRDLDWSIQVKAGDKLRLEGVYDSSIATWYEQMGIVMAWLAPPGTSGVDPFAAGVETGTGLLSESATDVVTPPTAPGVSLPGSDQPTCSPSATMICARGQATHARLATSGDHWSCELNGCPNIALNATAGQVMTDIPMGGFSYGPADFGVIPTLGIPIVPLGDSVTFWNLDTADYMWHTITRCENPCSGTTSADYPIANGSWDDLRAETGKTTGELVAELGPDPMDFDSGQLGVGTGATNNISWTFTPERAGTFSFFCRIHPSMRGAIRVV